MQRTRTSLWLSRFATAILAVLLASPLTHAQVVVSEGGNDGPGDDRQATPAWILDGRDLPRNDRTTIGMSADASLAVPFQNGDVFAAVSNGAVSVYRQNGTFVQTLQNGSGFTTGMAFDSNDNLYVTKFSSNQVDVYNSAGTFVSTFGSGYSTPESVVFDAAGNAYVGNLGNGIRRYSSTGTFLNSYATGRVDFFDIAADQCTVYYTQEGSNILAFDICTNSVLPVFASSLGGQAYAIRILPNGEVLLANGNNVRRLSATGTVLQTYVPANSGGWFALNLDPDGTSFWTGSFNTGNFYKVDLATGNNLVGPIATCGSQCMFGLAVFGEVAVAVSADLDLDKSVAPTSVAVGDEVTYTLTVTNNGPNAATGVTITDALPSGINWVSSTDCSFASGAVTCAVGALANGATATRTFRAQAVAEGVHVNTASVIGVETDAVPTNNMASATLTVQGGGTTTDTSAPVCGVITFDMSGNGSVVSSATDPQSGIASVRFTLLNNLTGFVDGAGPFGLGTTYTVPGTPATVELRGTRIDPSIGRAGLLAVVTNGDGLTSVCDPVLATLGTSADVTALGLNAPNPLRDQTTIPFSLAEAAHVRVAIYDVVGRELARLVDDHMGVGSYSVSWDGADALGSSLAPGTYIVRMQAGTVVQTRRLTIVR
jgi:uncharacterized repeat protein (TIGR01451 family)